MKTASRCQSTELPASGQSWRERHFIFGSFELHPPSRKWRSIGNVSFYTALESILKQNRVPAFSLTNESPESKTVQ